MSIKVIGLGYVGLPVACAFAKAGKTVYGIDKNKQLLMSLKSYTYNYTEPKLNDTLNEVLDKTLFVSETIIPSDTYIITVQTPINEDHLADNSFVEKALIELSNYIKEDDLVILESTVPIGSNEKFYQILCENIADNIDTKQNSIQALESEKIGAEQLGILNKLKLGLI